MQRQVRSLLRAHMRAESLHTASLPSSRNTTVSPSASHTRVMMLTMLLAADDQDAEDVEHGRRQRGSGAGQRSNAAASSGARSRGRGRRQEQEQSRWDGAVAASTQPASGPAPCSPEARGCAACQGRREGQRGGRRGGARSERAAVEGDERKGNRQGAGAAAGAAADRAGERARREA
eukprot:3321153-Rhodomonas_salina.1